MMKREAGINKRKLQWNMKAVSFIALLLFNMALFFLLIKFGKPFFATNDDFRMRLIVSGRYSGTPSAQATFLHIFLGYALSLLYKLAPTVEWYGGFFEIGMFISILISEFIFLKRVKSWSNLLIRFIPIIALSALVFQKQILMPQFTTLAAFFASAGICCLIEVLHQLQEKGTYRKAWGIVAAAFMSMACLVRGLVALMMLPMFVALCVVILYLVFKGELKVKFGKAEMKRIAILMLTTVVLVVGLRGIYYLNFASGVNKEYYRFNSARSSVVDYGGFPSWEDNRELYQSLGINKGVYKALTARNFDISYAVRADTLEAIAEAKDKLDITSWKNIGSRLHSMINIMCGSEARYAFFAVLIAFAFLFAISGKNKIFAHFVVPILLAYFFGVNAVLVLYGRLMARVVECLSIMTLMAIISSFGGLMFYAEKYSFKENALRILSVLMVLLVFGWTNQYSLQARSSTVRPAILTKTYQLDTLRQYAHEHPENFYFYNALDFIASSELVFDHSNEFENLESLGTWYVHSKLYNERNEQFGIHSAIHALLHNDNVYLAELGTQNAGLSGLMKAAGKKLVKVDSFEFRGVKIKIFKPMDIPKYENPTKPLASILLMTREDL